MPKQDRWANQARGQCRGCEHAQLYLALARASWALHDGVGRLRHLQLLDALLQFLRSVWCALQPLWLKQRNGLVIVNAKVGGLRPAPALEPYEVARNLVLALALAAFLLRVCLVAQCRLRSLSAALILLWTEMFWLLVTAWPSWNSLRRQLLQSCESAERYAARDMPASFAAASSCKLMIEMAL